MKATLTLVLLGWLISVLSSCHEPFICKRPDGPIETETLFIADFDGINLGVSGNLIVDIGPEQSVRIEAQRDIINNINRNIVSGVWNISLDDCYSRHDDINIYVTVPNLDYLALSSSGTINVLDPINTNELTVSLSGSGTLYTEVSSNQVNAYHSGSGIMTLKGNTNEIRCTLSGSGLVNAADLQVAEADVFLSGSGNIELRVSDILDVVLSGSGTVSYYGDPTVTTTITGSGSVRKKG